MALLDGFTDGLKNMFSGQGGGDGKNMFGMDNNTAGLLGMSLMNAGNQNGGGGGGGMLSNLMMMKMLGLTGDESGGLFGSSPRKLPEVSPMTSMPNYLKQDQNQSVNQTPLPADKTQLLSQLKQQAMSAYPNNPTMQQVAMTQAIHESGLMGKPSMLASRYNNYFGIKAPGTAGTVDMRTGEVVNGSPTTVTAGFGKNSSMGDSFTQHRNLMGNKRYQQVLSSQSPSDAFRALQQAGYATDPRYATSLNNVFNRYVSPMF